MLSVADLDSHIQTIRRLESESQIALEKAQQNLERYQQSHRHAQNAIAAQKASAKFFNDVLRFEVFQSALEADGLSWCSFSQTIQPIVDLKLYFHEYQATLPAREYSSEMTVTMRELYVVPQPSLELGQGMRGKFEQVMRREPGHFVFLDGTEIPEDTRFLFPSKDSEVPLGFSKKFGIPERLRVVDFPRKMFL